MENSTTFSQPTPGSLRTDSTTASQASNRPRPQDDNENQQPETSRLNMQRGRGGRARPRRPRPHEQFQKNQTILETIFQKKDYTKFYTITATQPNETLLNLDIINANKEMKSQINGTPTKVTELRDGSLLVEVASEEQSNKIKTIQRLNETRVSVTPHNSLNQTKGTIFFKNTYRYTNEQLLQELSTYKVIDIYHIERKINNEQMPTNIYILTFDACTLPEKVYIGWKDFDVREYIPRPRRCFKCQGYYHGSKNCRSEISICVTCGQEHHDTPCTRTASCKNCRQPHPASSKECFYYKLAQEVVTLQTRQKMSFKDARRKAMQTMMTPDTTYAAVTAKTTPLMNENREPQKQTTEIKRTPGNTLLSNIPTAIRMNIETYNITNTGNKATADRTPPTIAKTQLPQPGITTSNKRNASERSKIFDTGTIPKKQNTTQITKSNTNSRDNNRSEPTPSNNTPIPGQVKDGQHRKRVLSETQDEKNLKRTPTLSENMETTSPKTTPFDPEQIPIHNTNSRAIPTLVSTQGTKPSNEYIDEYWDANSSSIECNLQENREHVENNHFNPAEINLNESFIKPSPTINTKQLLDPRSRSRSRTRKN